MSCQQSSKAFLFSNSIDDALTTKVKTMTTSYVSLTQSAGSFAINFASGKNYKLAGVSGIFFTANNNFAVTDTTAATLNARITSGDLTITSGQATFSGLGNLQIQIATESTGLTLQLENVAAQAARNDAILAKKINVHTGEITQLRTDVDAKASVNDADTSSTTTTLSGSKISQLVSDAQNAAQNYATTAAGNIIDDAATGTDKVWSASKTTSAISDAETRAKNAAVEQIMGGITPAELDSLREIAADLTSKETVIGSIVTGMAKKVSIESQTLTSGEQAQVRTNIGAITADEATTIANDRISAVVGDTATLSVSAIWAATAFTLV